jgi:transposase
MAEHHDCVFRTEAEALRAKVSESEAKMAVLQARLDQVERLVSEQRKKAIGRTSEKSKRTPANKPPARPKNDAGAQAQRDQNRAERTDLPTETIRHQVADEIRSSCPVCANNCFVEVARDASTEYDWVPGKLVRRVHLREGLRCTACNHFERAPAPPRVVDGGHYGPALIAHLIVQKCADCVPIYRQQKALAREGIQIARSTLVDLFHRAAGLLKPIYDHMQELVPKHKVVYADETSLKMQRVEKLGFIWTFATETVVIYCFSPDRSGQTPERVLGQSEGLIVVDGYTGYNTVTVPGKRTRGGCNAHARRKFVDIDDENARKVIEHLDVVFRVERDAEHQGIIGQQAHLALRQERSRPAMEAARKLCEDNAPNYTPKSPMGAAIRYLLNQWAPLTLFLENVTIQPHNMISERLLRIIALGRKNYLFVGHKEGGDNLAMLCSLIATCVLHDVNPNRYLADVLIRVQTHPAAAINDLLPHRWKDRFCQPAGP